MNTIDGKSLGHSTESNSTAGQRPAVGEWIKAEDTPPMDARVLGWNELDGIEFVCYRGRGSGRHKRTA